MTDQSSKYNCEKSKTNGEHCNCWYEGPNDPCCWCQGKECPNGVGKPMTRLDEIKARALSVSFMDMGRPSVADLIKRDIPWLIEQLEEKDRMLVKVMKTADEGLDKITAWVEKLGMISPEKLRELWGLRMSKRKVDR